MEDVAVKDFDVGACFIDASKENMLTNLKPLHQPRHDEDLSMMLIYIHTILRYPNEKLVVPDEKHHEALHKFSPSHVLVVAPTSEDVLVVTRMDVSDADDIEYREGDIIAPLFVPADSSIVYNVHAAEAPIIKYTKEYISGALNFFNCVVRDNRATTERVVWRDPVARTTILEKATYDDMFALYIADGYLRVIDESYPYDNDMKNLALCKGFVRVLEETVSNKMVTRKMDDDMTEPLIVPWLRPVNYVDRIPSPDVEVDADEGKSKVFAIVYFLYFLNKVTRESRFTLVLTGFRDYGFLLDVIALFPRINIEVWSKTHPQGKLPSGVRHGGEVLAGPNLNKLKKENAFVFSDSDLGGDILLAGFSGPVMTKHVAVKKYKPNTSFLSCFSNAAVPSGYFIFNATRRTAAQSREMEDHKNRFLSTLAYVNMEFRDLSRWSYVMGDDEDTLGEMSYDEACLRLLLTVLV